MRLVNRRFFRATNHYSLINFWFSSGGVDSFIPTYARDATLSPPIRRGSHGGRLFETFTRRKTGDKGRLSCEYPACSGRICCRARPIALGCHTFGETYREFGLYP